MDKYSLSHLSDQELLRDLDARVGRVRSETAGLIACIAEIDARKLYRDRVEGCVKDKRRRNLPVRQEPRAECP